MSVGTQNQKQRQQMRVYRIVEEEGTFFVEHRFWFLFWIRACQEYPWDDMHKEFWSRESAEQYIKNQQSSRRKRTSKIVWEGE